jgi:hypothetical protein
MRPSANKAAAAFWRGSVKFPVGAHVPLETCGIEPFSTITAHTSMTTPNRAVLAAIRMDILDRESFASDDHTKPSSLRDWCFARERDQFKELISPGTRPGKAVAEDS